MTGPVRGIGSQTGEWTQLDSILQQNAINNRQRLEQARNILMDRLERGLREQVRTIKLTIHEGFSEQAINEFIEQMNQKEGFSAKRDKGVISLWGGSPFDGNYDDLVIINSNGNSGSTLRYDLK